MNSSKSPDKSGLFFSTMYRYFAASLLLHLFAVSALTSNLVGSADSMNTPPVRLAVIIRPSDDHQASRSISKHVADEGIEKSTMLPPSPPEAIPAGAPSLLRPTQFHERNELTRQPHVVENVDLAPLQKHFSQSPEPMRLELYVDASGVVVNIAPLAPTSLTEAVAHAITLLSVLRFTPGEIDERSVGTRIVIEVLLAPTINTGQPQTVN